ncbi:MAG TPA: Gfo/Idh/MocA family oxidoreductase [Candidatus Baltobacteraceae bacterium]
MKTYRIGIAGAGFGVHAHLPALLAHKRFEVVALASPHSAARVAEERGIPHHFRSCAEMLAGVELDAVTIASPPFAHKDDVSAALDARKPVICEKPFAISVADAEAMLGAAKAAGTACGVAHEFRFVPQAQALKELVVNHHLDPLRDVEITSLRPMLHRSSRRTRGWWFDRDRGGGLAGAMLSHLIDQASWLVARVPQRTLGMTRTANVVRHDDEGEFASTVDDGAFALLDYGDGLIARLTVDGTTAAEGYTCALHGEDRSAVASGSSMIELQLFTVEKDETSELDCKPSPYAKLSTINGNVPLLMELYDEFVKAIEGQPNALPTFEDAVATQRVLKAVGYGS